LDQHDESRISAQKNTFALDPGWDRSKQQQGYGHQKQQQIAQKQ
jgi:hypothetical protein